MTKLIQLIVILFLVEMAFSKSNEKNKCKKFNDVYQDAERIVARRRKQEKSLLEKGYVLTEADIGFGRNRQGNICNTPNFWLSDSGLSADNLNAAAKLMCQKNSSSLSSFSSNANCLDRSEKELKSSPKYRPLSGYGNNRKNPNWGTPNMPYGRYGPKNYADGISTIRKSVKGHDLPSPRKLVLDVLLKADKPAYTAADLNILSVVNELYITHDMAQQIPVEGHDNCQEIRCCTSGNKKVLDPSVSHSSCLPIVIEKDDEFYSKSGVGCLNMIRSESASSPASVQYGEVRNKVTSFLDHSIIYGSDETENKKIRSFVKGKLNLGSNNLLPVDSNGNYTIISGRLTTVPLSAIFPGLLARNHNSFCESLSKLNPSWNDEKLFEEARRLNIALYQKIFFIDFFTDAQGNPFRSDYNESVDPAATLEFISAAYRFFHTFMNPWMLLVDKNNKTEKIPTSETFGRIDIAETRFDDLLRGTLNDKANFGQQTDELYNKFSKNQKGLGLDIFAIDIQRCRDHGLPTYLEFRKKIGLKWNLRSFDGLLEIFPASYVKLLKNAYDDVRDIDLLIGGALESFLNFNNDFIGATFKNIIDDQFRNVIAGDSYYYSHKTNPYPFTAAQLAVIESYSFNHLICLNSGLDSLAKDWFIVANDNNNPLIPCSSYQQIDLFAWKGI